MTFAPPDQAWGSALLASHFLLLRQKKVSKQKATPGSAPFGFLALLGGPGGLLNSPAAQATQADCPRPACVAQRLSWGPQRRPGSTVVAKNADSHGQPEKTAKNETYPSSSAPALLLPLTRGRPGGGLLFNPLRGAEQRRKAGGLRRGLSEGRSPEFRSRPAFRVAQGTGAAGTDPGSPSFCLLFLGEARKSETPRKGGSPCQSSGTKP
jgi:hypothetical protein